MQWQGPYLFRQGCVFFQELHNTVRQLRMVHAQALDFMQGNKNSRQKELMLFLEWQCKPVDDRAENLQQLGNAVEAFGFVNKLEEDVVDGPADIRAEIEKFAVDAMERRFQKVALSWVFRVEQFKKLTRISGRNVSRVGQRRRFGLLTLSTKLWSMYAFAIFVLKS